MGSIVDAKMKAELKHALIAEGLTPEYIAEGIDRSQHAFDAERREKYKHALVKQLAEGILQSLIATLEEIIEELLPDAD